MESTRWEYKLIDSDAVRKSGGAFKAKSTEDIEGYLNRLGRSGWENRGNGLRCRQASTSNAMGATGVGSEDTVIFPEIPDGATYLTTLIDLENDGDFDVAFYCPRGWP